MIGSDMHSNILRKQPNLMPSASGVSITSVYGDLTFEQAACAVERCGIAFSTEIIELPGTCLLFKDPAIGFNFLMRWRGIVEITDNWEHPDLGLGIELEHSLPDEVRDWLDEVYRDAARTLHRTALLFSNELDRQRFAKAVGAR